MIDDVIPLSIFRFQTCGKEKLFNNHIQQYDISNSTPHHFVYKTHHSDSTRYSSNHYKLETLKRIFFSKIQSASNGEMKLLQFFYLAVRLAIVQIVYLAVLPTVVLGECYNCEEPLNEW